MTKINRPQNFRSFFFEMATPYCRWFFAMLLMGIYSAVHSSLDSLTEKFIQDSLQIEMNHRTVIVIAHRLSTILSMDNILVMDNGKIIETGNHKQFIVAGGFYKALWDAQSGHSFI